MTDELRSSRIDLGELGLDQGAHLLLKRAMSALPAGGELEVRGRAPVLDVHLRAWARAQGHELVGADGGGSFRLRRGGAAVGRWRGAVVAGDAATPSARAPQTWGLAARSATVEAGMPEFRFALDERASVWAEDAGRLYAQAVAAQWDPTTDIDWGQQFDLPAEVEDAVVQVMTYLIENETAALIIPARFASQVHPHYREVMQLLAVQAADEARHIDVFTRRALLNRPKLGLSTVGGQASLKTLLDEPDFATSSMLLSVLGEGSFLSLLWFLHQHGPDPITRDICQLAARDEARHVAFGLAHLAAQAAEEPELLARLAQAIRGRNDVLSNTAGLNEDVFDSLLLMAAGSWEPGALRHGWEQVQELVADMDRGRVRRLRQLGFGDDEALELSALHTRNFM